MGEKFITLAELAKHLRIHPQTLKRWVLRGVLPCTRIGRKFLFEEKRVKEAIAAFQI